MDTLVKQAPTFTIGDITINRLGFGAMRITGEDVWGEPADRVECLRTLRRLPELGVNFIDTADSYGPDISEELIAEALAPYEGILVATKAGLVRPGPGAWIPMCKPDYLVQQAYKSRRRLGVKQIDLWQLHTRDSLTPIAESFSAITRLLDEGVIRHVGLSNVRIEDIEAARKLFPVATVQLRYNLVTRDNEAVLDYCEANGIGFIPWFPLAAGELARPGTLLDALALKYAASHSQIALAWMLKRSPVMLPIPGTSKVMHLEENVAAAGIILSDVDFAALDEAAKAA